MKRINVIQKNGQNTFNEMIDPTEWVASCVAGNFWGLPERIVEDIEGTYDPADVIEKYSETVKAPVIAYEMKPDESGNMVEVPFELEPGIYHKTVKLKAEYTIEIEDISYEHEMNQCMVKRKSEYPTMEEFLNAYFDGGEVAVQALQAQRLEVKQKYQKPEKE